MKAANGIADLVGKTPLLALRSYCAFHRLDALIYAKLEGCNPLGSHKDRVALALLRYAQQQGLPPGGLVIEGSEGGLAVSLAAFCAAQGYKMVAVLPENTNPEHRQLCAALGAQVIVTPAAKGLQGALDKARELHRKNPGSFFPNAYSHPACPQAHYETTAEEIWKDTQGEVDIFVAAAGTGGTLSGVSRKLKKRKKTVQVIAVEPAESPVLSGGAPGAAGCFGMGPGFVPENFTQKWVDEVFPVKREDAFGCSCALASAEGLLIGPSAGAVVWAATQIARLPEHKGKVIVALLPDSGERYLQSGLFSRQEHWFVLE